MICVPPFRSEFGILLRFHAPAVRALPRPVTVAHEAGLEALYPDVDRIIVESKPDIERRWTHRHDQEFVDLWRARFEGADVVTPDKENRLPIEPFRPEPFEPQRKHSEPMVVICPRMRQYGAEKNWDFWPWVARRLRDHGMKVFSAGLQETSYAVEADEYAWDYPRPLDATLEALQSAPAVLATASGLSLLAVLCGAPLHLVGADGGRVAPGPAKDITGKVHHDRYWGIPLADYYHPLNHLGSPIEVYADGWDNPGLVVKSVVEAVS